MNVQICCRKKPIMVKSIYALLSAKKLPKNPLPNLAKKREKREHGSVAIGRKKYCTTKND